MAHGFVGKYIAENDKDENTKQNRKRAKSNVSFRNWVIFEVSWNVERVIERLLVVRSRKVFSNPFIFLVIVTHYNKALSHIIS